MDDSANGAIDRIARETMTGDLRDCLLDFLKHDKNPLPWNLQGESQQRETIEKATKAVEHAVERAVRIIAADGRRVMLGTLTKVMIKDGYKAEIVLSASDPLRHELCDAQGQDVLLVVAGEQPYFGERRAAHPDPDEPDLPMAELSDSND